MAQTHLRKARAILPDDVLDEAMRAVPDLWWAAEEEEYAQRGRLMFRAGYARALADFRNNPEATAPSHT